MNKYSTSLLLLLIGIQFTAAQVVYTDPAIPVDTKPVTIYFDATQGTGGLADYTGDIYAHIGVLTNLSTGGTDWKYVKTNWGENTPETRLTRISDNLYSLEIIPTIRGYYGVPSSESITHICLVFRSSDSSLEGKDEGGKDIFVAVFEEGLNLNILTPQDYSSIVDLDETLELNVVTELADTVALFINNQFITGVGSVGSLTYALPTGELGLKKVMVWAANDQDELSDSLFYYVMGAPNLAALPDGMVDGINYLSENSVILSFFAPGKKAVFAIGDFSDWLPMEEYFMNITPDGQRFWVQIEGLDPSSISRFYYQVDHGTANSAYTKFADPYSELILDPKNDKYIGESTFPGISTLISGVEQTHLSLINTDRTPYDWRVADFSPPEKTDLVVYEILLRDFLSGHDWEGLLDTLDYIENLGINAIELMPFNEYNNNESWGYNPTYFFAPDKYYGPPEDLKAFIDECHSRGIAVIQDMVFNHVEYISTFANLYLDNQGLPSEENPWLNADYDLDAPGYQTRHPYSVFLDFDHSSIHTQNLIDRATRYWMEEYKIDGFRFDLTKGFTQKSTYQYFHYSEPNDPYDYAVYNEGEASAYDPERIGYLKRMADAIWEYNAEAYVILEHFCINSEEKELANYGMMVWGNHNFNYNEATMGYNDGGKSNFGGISYQNREWTYPHLVGYMESHDEERLMFKNVEYGNSFGYYSVKELNTALARIELAAAFFLTIPGPKMIWQFGELGYDYSIEYNGRVGKKPIKWDYYDVNNRKKLYQVFSALAELKISEPVFETNDYTIFVSGAGKRIELNHADMDMRIVGNFDIDSIEIDPNFSQAGTWYEFFTGEGINVTDIHSKLKLRAGEYRIYTTKQLETPDIIEDVENLPVNETLSKIYPNPTRGLLNVSTRLPVEFIIVTDLNGREVYEENTGGTYQPVDLTSLSGGVYFLRVKFQNGASEYHKFIKQ